MGETDLNGRTWLSPKQAAEYLDVSESTIYRLTRAGKLKAYKIGGLRRYRRDELDAALEPVRVPAASGKQS